MKGPRLRHPRPQLGKGHVSVLRVLREGPAAWALGHIESEPHCACCSG